MHVTAAPPFPPHALPVKGGGCGTPQPQLRSRGLEATTTTRTPSNALSGRIVGRTWASGSRPRESVGRLLAFHRPPHGRSQVLDPLAPPRADQIRIATSDDLKFCDHLQRKFADCVGFLPRLAFEKYLADGHVNLALENDDAAGYILSKPQLQWQPLMRPIYQACIAMDAQRRHHGLALLQSIATQAKADGKLALQANCASGLEANEFWRAAGFKPIMIMTPENVRGREVICWRLPLQRSLPFWFAQPPARAGHLARKPKSIRVAGRDYSTLRASLGLSAAATPAT